MNRDTQAMLSLARFVQRRTSIGLRTDVVTLVGEFTDAVNAELDFTAEGQAGERIRNDRGDDEGIHIPAVHLELCTRRLLVLEEVSGRPVSDQAALDASPVPRDELAERLLALLPRADPRGRGVPRRPASRQHPRRPRTAR